jgi:hypothetical protein
MYLMLLDQKNEDISNFKLAKEAFYNWYEHGNTLFGNTEKALVANAWLAARRKGEEAMMYLHASKACELLLKQEDIVRYIRERVPYVCKESD